jgi:hypothetical protein
MDDARYCCVNIKKKTISFYEMMTSDMYINIYFCDIIRLSTTMSVEIHS